MDDSPVNEDYSVLSRGLFALLLVLFLGFFAELANRALALLISIASGTAPWGAVAAPVSAWALIGWKVLRRRPRSPAQGSKAIHLQALIAPLARALRISCPEVRISDDESDARVVFVARTPYVLAPRSMDLLALVKPDSIRPVMIHELAHLANRDAVTARVTRTLIQASIVLGSIVAIAYFLAYMSALIDWGQSYGFLKMGYHEAWMPFSTPSWIMVFGMSLLLIDAAFLRMREFEADRLVARLGYGDAMAKALLEKPLPIRNRLRLHPTPQQRAKSLLERASVHAIEHQVIFLVSAAVIAINLLTSRLDESASSMIAFAVAAPLGIGVLTLLGISFGRRLGMDEIGKGDEAKELAKAALFLLAGTSAALFCVDLLMNPTPGAPLYLEIWEALVQGTTFASALAAAFLSSHLIGRATAKSLLPLGSLRVLWWLLSFILALLIFGIVICLASAFLDPYGIEPSAKFWIAASELQGDLGSVLPEPKHWRINFNGVVLVGIAISSTAVTFLWLTTKLIVKNESTMYRRGRNVQASFWLAALLGVAVPTTLVASLTIDIAKELQMSNSLWVTCAARPSESDRVYGFSEAVVSNVGAILGHPSKSPPAYIGMASLRCGAVEHERYPLVRAALARAKVVDDVFLEIDASMERIRVASRDGPSGQPETLALRFGDDATGVARAIASKYAPYRMAWATLQAGGSQEHALDSPLLAVMADKDAVQRAWAHSTFGNQLFHSDLDAAEPHLRQAVEILPSQPIFHGDLAHALLRRNRCAEAMPHLKFAAQWGEVSNVVARGYARCLVNEAAAEDGFIAVWKLRSLFPKDPEFYATIAEVSLWADRVPLARLYAPASMNLAADAAPPGCARLFSRLFENVDICNSTTCTPPLAASQMTGEERACWTRYSARYGHAFKVD